MNKYLNDNQPVIAAVGISKKFGDRVILDNLNLTVPAGKIYGLMGHNGAGKSVFLRIICGLVHPTAGSVTVFRQRIGRDVEFPGATGAIIDTPGFLPHYSGSKNLELLAMIRGQITKDEIAATIRLVGLDPQDRRPVRTYSTGMRQRLGLAQALMEKPRLLILDEPTSGLDLAGIRDIHNLLKDLRATGATILITSHSKEELHELCDAAFLMDRGQLAPIAIPATTLGHQPVPEMAGETGPTGRH